MSGGAGAGADEGRGGALCGVQLWTGHFGGGAAGQGLGGRSGGGLPGPGSGERHAHQIAQAVLAVAFPAAAAEASAYSVSSFANPSSCQSTDQSLLLIPFRKMEVANKGDNVMYRACRGRLVGPPLWSWWSLEPSVRVRVYGWSLPPHSCSLLLFQLAATRCPVRQKQCPTALNIVL